VHGPLHAQIDSVRTALQTVESKYNSGAYLSAEIEARRLLEHAPLGDSAIVALHKYIACSLIAQGKPDIAREHFKSILAIDPDFSLDPVYTSPKILVVFNEAKQSFLSSRKILKNDFTPPLINNPHSITYRAIVFPGWEQVHAGRTTVGSLFLGAGLVTIAAEITFEFLRSSARQKYLASTDPTDIRSKYNLYNRYYKAEIASFAAFAVVYGASEIEIFAFDHSPSVSLQPAVSSVRGTTLTFAVRF
jgi:tetratricopeptide (TPR) repeat protein